MVAVEEVDRAGAGGLAGGVGEGHVCAEEQPELDDRDHDQEQGQQHGDEFDEGLSALSRTTRSQKHGRHGTAGRAEPTADLPWHGHRWRERRFGQDLLK